MRIGRALCLALLAVVLLPTLAEAQSERHNRRSFLQSTPAGSIGFVPFADDKPSAQTAWRVMRLAEESCEALPLRNRYWFRLNHLRADLVGQVAYFSIRIVALSAANDGQLTLYRNENWSRRSADADTPLGVFDKAAAQVDISIPDFVDFHHRDTPAPDEAVIGSEIVSAFHASIVAESGQHESWDDRFLITSLADDAALSPSRMLIQHLRFTVTNNRETPNAPVFFIDRNDATEAHIFVAAPGLLQSGEDYSVRVVFGGSC